MIVRAVRARRSAPLTLIRSLACPGAEALRARNGRSVKSSGVEENEEEERARQAELDRVESKERGSAALIRRRSGYSVLWPFEEKPRWRVR